MLDERDPIDVAARTTELWTAHALAARTTPPDYASAHCIDCGADNAPRAALGRSRCIECQVEYERC